MTGKPGGYHRAEQREAITGRGAERAGGTGTGRETNHDGA